MKLIIKNKSGVVKNARIKKADGIFHLHITTRERWVKPDSISGEEDNKIKTMEINFATVQDYNDVYEWDTVKLIAESEDDREILNRVEFLKHSKNELWYIFVENKLLGVD